MKKTIIISASVIASLGLGYFIYKKIRDRNKEIIEDGGFTIKVSEDATTNESDFDEYGISSGYYSDDTPQEAPSWSSSSDTYSEY